MHQFSVKFMIWVLFLLIIPIPIFPFLISMNLTIFHQMQIQWHCSNNSSKENILFLDIHGHASKGQEFTIFVGTQEGKTANLHRLCSSKGFLFFLKKIFQIGHFTVYNNARKPLLDEGVELQFNSLAFF